MHGNSLIEKLLNFLNISGDPLRIASGVIISLGIILICGFLMTRFTKLLRLPNVTAYIVVGILIGPSLINLIPQEFIDHTDFVSDIALALIAFSVGEYFKFDVVKKGLGKAIVITLFETIITFVLVFLLCNFAFRLGATFSLILAALASATAPTSTLMTIKQTKAQGHYVNTLLEVVVLDVIIAMILFTISITVFVATFGTNSVQPMDIIWPILKMFICLVIGFGFGFVLKFLISYKRTTDNRLIIVLATLLLFCGICSLLGQSPLLGAVVIGMVYTNMCKSRSEEKLFAQVNYFIPPIMLIFFVRGGMSLNFKVFANGNPVITSVPLIVIVLAVLFARLVGKYGGSYVGSVVTAQPKETRNYLGLGLLPQASVAIALATMGVRTLESAGLVDHADALLAIILASSIIFELVGPACAKLGLYLSHSYGPEVDDEHTESKEEKANEEAYTEAAEQYQEH